jgi:hypothetical protein
MRHGVILVALAAGACAQPGYMYDTGSFVQHPRPGFCSSRGQAFDPNTLDCVAQAPLGAMKSNADSTPPSVNAAPTPAATPVGEAGDANAARVLATFGPLDIKCGNPGLDFEPTLTIDANTSPQTVIITDGGRPFSTGPVTHISWMNGMFRTSLAVLSVLYI